MNLLSTSSFYFLTLLFGGSLLNYMSIFYSSLGLNCVIVSLIAVICLNFNKILNYFYIDIESLIFFLLGFDVISLVLLLLSVIVFPLCFIYNYFYVTFSSRMYSFFLFFVEFVTLFSFVVNNLLVFYFLFESLLFPMFLLIGLWGARGRKVHAGYQFFFYTTTSSIFVLLGLFILFLDEGGSFFFSDFASILLCKTNQILIGIFFF